MHIPALHWDAVGEIAKVIDKNGNTLFLDRGLHFTYDPKLFPMIKRIGLVENAGIENIKIYRPNGNKDNMNIAIERAYNCWIRNVESSWAMKCHVSLVRSYHCEIRDNYIHHAYDYGGGGHGYGVSINHRATSCLIEHNIFKTLRHAMVLSYAPIGNVCGYNFSTDSNDPSANFGLGDIKADISLHGFYPLMNLFEGNIVEYIHSSDWWGPSGPGNTFFRNRATHQPLYISDNSHYQNVIGNELTYNPIGWADNFEIDASIGHTTKHSNNDLGDIDVNKISTLPNSLYKTSPNFNFGFPIPNIGPVSGINPSGDYPYDMHDNKPKYRYYNSTYKAPCTAICATNLIDEYSSCETSVDLVLPVGNTVKILYGITIEDIPNTYGGGTEGNPEIYIKMYTNGGTLVFSSENSYISAVPDIYISCDYLPIDVNETYHVYVYDDDGSTNPDDFLGTVSFQGSSNSSYFYDYISGQLLQINLNKESYNTQYEWNTGNQSNSITVNQSGTYSAIVTNYFGCEIEDSTIVILASPPQISSQTLTSQEICTGSTINPFSVNITGGIDLTYQWYNNSINSTTGGNPISSATNSTYQPNNSNAGNFYYYCLISDTNTACTDVYSSIATIQINEPLTITNQPILAQSTCTNGNINPLSISISGGGIITYQWYENTLNSTNGGTLISGSNSSSYTPPSNTSGTMYYYCMISSSGTGCNNINSDISEITIILPINISSQPLILQEVCLGSSLIDVSITSIGGNNPNYQWYNNSINSNSGGTIITGATSSSYSPPSNTIGEFYYYCTITSSINGCNSMTSDVSEIIIHEPNSISQHPTSYEEICINDNNINIQLAASGNNNTYQWYQNNSSSYTGGQLIVGAVASNYNPSSVSPDTIYYFCIVSNTNSTCPNDTTLITTVNFIDYPAASFSYLDSALTVEFSNSSTNSNQFEWIFGDGTSSISTDPSHQYQSSGSYTVYLIAENSCNSDTTMQIITLTVSNIEELGSNDFIIYPNPANGKCMIDLMDSLPRDGCLQLIDLNGKLVLKKNINNRLTEFDLKFISSGEYIIIYSAKDFEIIKKLIVQ